MDVSTMGVGSHVYSIYRNLEEQFLITFPILAKGLSENDKCLYIADLNLEDRVKQEYRSYLDSEQLEFIDNKIYLENGLLNINKLISSFDVSLQKAEDDGYNNLRVAGELPFIDGKTIDNDKVVEYEALVDKFITSKNIIAVCSYDENKYSPDFLTKIIKSHQYVAIYGRCYKNIFYNSSSCPKEYRETIQKLIEV